MLKEIRTFYLDIDENQMGQNRIIGKKDILEYFKILGRALKFIFWESLRNIQKHDLFHIIEIVKLMKEI